MFPPRPTPNPSGGAKARARATAWVDSLRDTFSLIVGRRGVLFALLCVFPLEASAQLAGKSVSEDSGPVSEASRSVSHGSRPVHESGRSTHESSVGSLSGNSAREASVAPMKSGAVSEISAGTVTSNRSLRRERTARRLAPAPPRIGREEETEATIEWQPVYELDELIEDLSALEPMPREEPPPADQPSADAEEVGG